MVDKVDLQIIEQLNQDGRKSMREIAGELDISPSTASSRFKKLKEKGIIEKTRPVIDYGELGYKTTALIEFEVEGGKKEILLARLGEKSRVKYVYAVTGGTDIIAICRFLDSNDMYSFLKQLQGEEGILQTTTHVVLDSRDVNEGLKPEELAGKLD